MIMTLSKLDKSVMNFFDLFGKNEVKFGKIFVRYVKAKMFVLQNRTIFLILRNI